MSKEITLINTGICAIVINGELIMPDEEVKVDESTIELQGFAFLFARGELEVKDNAKLTKKIKESLLKAKKPDSLEGKSLKELEDGGEI